MGIEGISGGGSMRALQAIKPVQGPDLDQLQSSGLRVDQDVRQLMNMLQSAAAMGTDPERIKDLVNQLKSLIQSAPPAADTATDVGAAGAGGVSGAASQEYAKRLDDLKKQIETISNVAASEGSGMSQQNLVNQQLNVLGMDQNQAQGRDFMNMY